MSLIGDLWRRLTRGSDAPQPPTSSPRRTADPEDAYAPQAEEPGASWRAKADASDARAKRLGVDPPRPGRKTYGERHDETSRMSTADIHASIAAREAAGKECGVLYRVLAERGED